MSKERIVFACKLAVAGALGAVLPMLPEMVSGLPSELGAVISAAVTALAFALNPPKKG